MSKKEKSGLSRRVFLGASVGAVVGAGVGACDGTEPPGGTGSGGVPGTGGSSAAGVSSGGKSSGGAGADGGVSPKVCLVRNTDVVQAVRNAVAAVGGLPDLTGKTVLLKPN